MSRVRPRPRLASRSRASDACCVRQAWAAPGRQLPEATFEVPHLFPHAPPPILTISSFCSAVIMVNWKLSSLLLLSLRALGAVAEADVSLGNGDEP